MAQIQRLIDAATSQGVPVLQVFHTSVSDDPANPFAGVRARQDAERAEDLAYRRVPQDRALLALRQGQDGATLHDWLRDHDIGEVIVSGIRTEQCCETTSRHASDAGFKVIFPTDATLTFAMQSPSGRQYTPAEIRDRTELVLQGRFARVLRAADVLAA